MIKNKIIYYPSKKLTMISKPVVDFSNILQIKNQLIDIHILENGLGVAAPQIGIDKRIFYYNFNNGIKNEGFIINPIIETSGKKVSYNEGCLSIPGYFKKIFRPENVEMQWVDEKENMHVRKFSGLLSRLIQHEVDHLDGKLIIDLR